MDKKVYRVTVGASGYLPHDSYDCDSLWDMRQTVKAIIADHKETGDEYESPYTYRPWENLYNLKRSHFIHAGDAGITVGLLQNEQYTIYISIAYVDESL